MRLDQGMMQFFLTEEEKNSFHVIVCQYLRSIVILLRLLQRMCLCHQKSYEEQKVPFILMCLLLNAIKVCGVKLVSRQKYIFPVDVTNISSFDINVVNTTRICTSALLNLFDKGRKFWQKNTVVPNT